LLSLFYCSWCDQAPSVDSRGRNAESSPVDREPRWSRSASDSEALVQAPGVEIGRALVEGNVIFQRRNRVSDGGRLVLSISSTLTFRGKVWQFAARSTPGIRQEFHAGNENRLGAEIASATPARRSRSGVATRHITFLCYASGLSIVGGAGKSCSVIPRSELPSQTRMLPANSS
jgi:hypothetical protein